MNHSPSFCTDSALDRDVKGTLIWDTLNLINVGALDRRRCADEEKRRIKDRLLGKGGRKETKYAIDCCLAMDTFSHHLANISAFVIMTIIANIFM